MGEKEEFNTLTFEKKLMQLKDTQESIQSLSTWCLRQREHHKKIVSSWLNVLKRVKVEQRLVLFYLANDVIQYSKRKNYEFVESWGLNLQKATPLVREEKVRQKILRIFKIWEERSVYDDEFLSDLTGLLSAGAIKKTDDDALDFQPQQLVNKIKQCTVLEADTDLRLKYIHESHLELSDADALCANLKDRSSRDDVEKELNEGIGCVERYTQSLQREIVAREALLALLASAKQYYSTQRGEVKVVAYAYKNFGARVRALKRKLDELVPTLVERADPSPPRAEDVPSPGPDEDLELPGNDDVSYNIDKTFNTSLTADGSLFNMGLSSFLSSDNPLAMFNDSSQGADSNKIEVIGSRQNDKEDFDINSFLKNLVPNETNLTPDNVAVSSGPVPPPPPSGLPSPDHPPPTSFYGTRATSTEPDQPYHPENVGSQWSQQPPPNWNMPLPVPAPVTLPPPSLPPPMVPPPALSHAQPPASPPREEAVRAPDVDHRSSLPPPPPPPLIPTLSVLGPIEDVDHRLLPPPIPPAPAPIRHINPSKDVDHRNLIPLTHQPPPQLRPQLADRGIDQDYRVPPVSVPTDIVEIVDMDLSEDEEQTQPGMYPNPNQVENSRRNSFNQNNKVLVGGDNGKTNHTDFVRTNSMPEQNRFQDKMDIPPPNTAPVVPPLSNPFDNMPAGLKQFNSQPFRYDPRTREDDDHYEDEPMAMQQDMPDNDFRQEVPQRFANSQRFPRNWSPQTNFPPPGFGLRPRGPRPQRPWHGNRPRFW